MSGVGPKLTPLLDGRVVGQVYQERRDSRTGSR
jgi:hypothetical protein